jgi:hypothetical protein
MAYRLLNIMQVIMSLQGASALVLIRPVKNQVYPVFVPHRAFLKSKPGCNYGLPALHASIPSNPSIGCHLLMRSAPYPCFSMCQVLLRSRTAVLNREQEGERNYWMLLVCDKHIYCIKGLQAHLFLSLPEHLRVWIQPKLPGMECSRMFRQTSTLVIYITFLVGFVSGVNIPKRLSNQLHNGWAYHGCYV